MITMTDKNSDSSAEDKINGRQQNGNLDDVCRDYLRNVCKRGKRCRYRHPDALNSAEPANPRKQEQVVFCHDYQNAGCRRPNCKFIHCTREEEDYFKNTGQLPPTLVAPPAPINGPMNGPVLTKQAVVAEFMATVKGEAPICKDFLKGECRRAGKCKYKHLSNAEFDFEIRRLERPIRLQPTITRFESPPFDDLFDRFDHEIALKRRRLDYDDALERYHGVLQPSRPFTADYKLLEEENLMLRRRIEELRKQVTDLAATNEVLLEQNARYRVAKSSSMSLPVSTSCAPSVVTGQVVTPTNTPAPIVVSSITASRLPLPLHKSLPHQCIPSLQQPLTLSSGLANDLTSQQVIHQMEQKVIQHQMEQIATQVELATQQAAASMNTAGDSMGAATLVAATPVTLSQTILTPVAVSMATVSVQQNLPVVSMPQRSIPQLVMSGPATAAMVSYPIMSQGVVARSAPCVP